MALLERLNYTSDNMREHVYQLAAAFSVTVVELEDLPLELNASLIAFRSKTLREAGVKTGIVIRKIVDEVCYAVALHELGHIAHPTGSVRDQHTAQDYGYKLLEERSAWEWAHAHAFGWTKKMQAFEEHAIGTYVEGARASIAPVTSESVQDFLRRIR